jgi:hypothetical protein
MYSVVPWICLMWNLPELLLSYLKDRPVVRLLGLKRPVLVHLSGMYRQYLEHLAETFKKKHPALKDPRVEITKSSEQSTAIWRVYTT